MYSNRFTAGQVAKITGVSYHTINYLAKTGVVVPSVQAAHGSNTISVYSRDDAVAIKAVGVLAAAGYSQKIKRLVADKIRPVGVLYVRDDLRLIIGADGVSLVSLQKLPPLIRELKGGVLVFDVCSIAREVSEAAATVEKPNRGKAARAVRNPLAKDAI